MDEQLVKKRELRYKNTLRSTAFKNLLEKFELHEKSVLDIGCSYGEFLVHFGAESLGITILQKEVDYGKNKGLNIVLGDIESPNLAMPMQSFDVIFANNIFEHLMSPHQFLLNMKKYLKPGGFMILGVPCVPKLSSLLASKKFSGSLAVGHINFFTKLTLQKTVERGGWTIDELRSFHFKNAIFDKLLNLISPHFYAIAKPDKNFMPKYHEK